MADKDLTEKNLEACNYVFADIVNVLLFNGKEIVKLLKTFYKKCRLKNYKVI